MNNELPVERVSFSFIRALAFLVSGFTFINHIQSVPKCIAMATLTRQNVKTSVSTYKDYVNFLETYKTASKDDQRSEDSGISIKHLSKTSSTSTSSSSLNSDNVDSSKSTSSCVSYKAFRENTQSKKFATVKPAPTEDKPVVKRSEIFIEIQPSQKHVSEVSKIFEQSRKQEPHRTSESKISSRIDLFERQKSQEKPRIGQKPKVDPTSPKNFKNSPKLDEPNVKHQESIHTFEKVESTLHKNFKVSAKTDQPISKPQESMENVEKRETTPPKSTEPNQNQSKIPPPPPMMVTMTPPKIQATLKSQHTQIHKEVSVESTKINQLDRNDPAVRKLVYGTLRGLYGAYHDQANGMAATMPRNMVRKNNGIQKIISEMATNGDLDKLSGRANPKQEI